MTSSGGKQDWAEKMAALLIGARAAARDARQAGETAWTRRSWTAYRPLPGTRRWRARREPLPADRDR